MRTPEQIKNAKAQYNSNLIETELSSLPEGYIQGGELTITLGDVIVKPLIANIQGKQVSRPNPTNIRAMKWITPKINNTTFYIYIDRYGFFFVDTVADIAIQGRYGTYNPRTLTRFVGKIYVNGVGFYVTTEIIGIQIIGYSGEGSNAEPKEGDRRVFIDDDEIGFEEYTGGDWTTVNSIKLGGSSSNGLFYPFFQGQGSVNTLADEISQEFFPGGRLVTFEDSFNDQNGVGPTASQFIEVTTTGKKFGTNAGGPTHSSSLGRISYTDTTILNDSPIGVSMYMFKPTTTGSGNDVIGQINYTVDGQNSAVLNLFYDSDNDVIFLRGKIVVSAAETEVDSSSFSVAVGVHHYVSFGWDGNTTIFVTVDDNSEELILNISSVSGSPTTQSFLASANNTTNPRYIDEVQFSTGSEVNSDLFIQHLNHNVAWNTDFSAKDYIIKPATGGAVIIDQDLHVEGALTVDGGMPNAVPIGSVMAHTTGTAPAGYKLCDGTSYLRTELSDLFDVIGTAYGSVDGTHFNVPNSDYSTAWINRSDWTNVHMGSNAALNTDSNVTHNLDVPLSELDVKVILSEDGTDATSFEILTVMHTNTNIGLTLYDVDDNNIRVQTGFSGISRINDATGNTTIIDTEDWYYKITVERKDFPKGSIIRATNTSVTLENVTSATIADLIVTNSAIFHSDIVMPKASGKGIKVDRISPTFGFADLLGEVFQRNTGASKPTRAAWKGGTFGFQFAAGKNEEFEFHIPHDYVPGTAIFLHIHWGHNASTVTGGTITFDYEMTYSKGHGQESFGTNAISTLTSATAFTGQYSHDLSEAQVSVSGGSGTQIDTDGLEPDGIIKATVGVNSVDLTVSGGGVPDPFIHYVDIHYQTKGVRGTKGKAPDFYA